MKKFMMILCTVLALVLPVSYTSAAEIPNVSFVMNFDESATGLTIQSTYSKTSEDGYIEDVVFTWNCYDYVCRTSEFNIFQNIEHNDVYGVWKLVQTKITDSNTGEDVTLQVIQDAYFEIPAEIEIKKAGNNRFEASIRLSENNKIVNEEYNRQEKEREDFNKMKLDKQAGVTDDMTEEEKEAASLNDPPKMVHRSTELGVYVYAPTESVFVDENGNLFVTDSDILAEMWYNSTNKEEFRETGKWIMFKPQQVR